MLSLRIPLGVGESATSYCSRLAAWNRCLSVREFCLDVGLSFREIVNGTHNAVAALARLGSVDFDRLWRSTMRRSRETAICGRNLVGVGLRRAPVRLFVCPACLASDASENPELGDNAFFGRTAWLIEPIRTCIRHARALIDLNPAPGVHGLNTHDFSVRIRRHAGRIIGLAESAPPVTPTDFERYLVSCIEGTPPIPGFWPDSMPFHIVAVGSEMMGSLHLFGPKRKIKELNENQKREACAAGFHYLAAGPEGFRQGLIDNLSRWPQSRGGFARAGSYFGPLYIWLREQREDPASDQLRDIMREVMLSFRPLGPGGTLFGEPVTNRQVYSVHSTAATVGLHPSTMCRMLVAAGILNEAALSVSSHRAVFPVNDNTTAFLDRLRRSLSGRDTQEYLGLNRSQFLSLLQAKLVRPFLTLPSTTRWNRHYFDPIDLDAFLDGLSSGRAAPGESITGMKPIRRACRQAGSSLVEAVRMVQSGRLQRVFRSSQGRGLDTILVDPIEIRDSLMLPKLNELTMAQVSSRTGLSPKTVSALARQGVLASKTVPNPITKLPQKIISPEGLMRFDEEYVALTVLSAQRCISPQKLKLSFDGLGLRPAFDQAEMGAVFYRRRDVEKAPNLLISGPSLPSNEIQSCYRSSMR